ncbi:neprosin family prolyl endopeptidase [Streptomyces sp. DSM 41987]|uniref:neprosin family prolyl endopeptidase n=1 Tax=Streptomyces TaxID=1883 RepID=UPI0018DFB509|nr:neprosin family prolyl endopeptidase [Streptomyces fildesensis]
MHIRTSFAVGLAAAAALAVLPGSPAHATETTPATATSSAPTVPPAADATTPTGPTCWFGACYDYVYGRQTTDTAGAAVRMEISDPEVNPTQIGEHSLQELALQDTNRVSTVEVGWTVDPQLNGDSKPHLFVYHWVDGQTSCYNGCGFVPVSTKFTAGMALRPGHAADFAIRNIGGDWWISYDHHDVGYFPGSLWKGTYSRAQVVTAFGEVAANTADVPSCTDMGNGRPGASPRASWISDYRLYKAADKPRFTVSASSPQLYTYGKAKATSFRLGGSGSGRC